MDGPGRSFHSLWQVYEDTPLNTEEIPQQELNLDSSRNTNPFRYRGQFSPDLVARLLDEYAEEDDVVFDPFLGCGTTVYEGVKRGLDAYGTEINTAGVEMASLVEFTGVPEDERERIISEAISIADQIADPGQARLGESGVKLAQRGELLERIVNSIEESDLGSLTQGLLVNGLMEWNYTSGSEPKGFTKEVRKFGEFAKNLPYIEDSTHEIFQRDCRFTPLSTNSVDLVLTSPPYINVHNYHQHHRDSIEEFGWDILTMAKSEFGSNRKNRQNRFKTVIQFAIDIAQVFAELRRTLSESGRAIFVVGRTSTVRGVQFNNGQFIAAIGSLAGFNLLTRQERVYQNNFGTEIFEDILHFEKDESTPENTVNLTPDEFGKDVLRHALKNSSIEEKDVMSDIKDAIMEECPQPSPVMCKPVESQE